MPKLFEKLSAKKVRYPRVTLKMLLFGPQLSLSPWQFSSIQLLNKLNLVPYKKVSETKRKAVSYGR